MAWQRRIAKLLPARNGRPGFLARPPLLFPNRHGSYFDPRLHPFDAANGNEDVEAGTVLAVASSWKHHQGNKDMVVNTCFAALVLLLVMTLARIISAHAVVGGAPMYADKNIAGNAANFTEHIKLVAAVQAAGVVDILKDPGSLTAFAALPARLVDTLPG